MLFYLLSIVIIICEKIIMISQSRQLRQRGAYNKPIRTIKTTRCNKRAIEKVIMYSVESITNGESANYTGFGYTVYQLNVRRKYNVY